MNKPSVKVIVFDLGNVLIPFDYKLAINNFNKISPGLGEKFYDYYFNHYEIHRAFERGELPEKEFINQMLEVLEHKVDREKFCKFYSEIFSINENVAGLLPKLKSGYRLVLLSNTNSIHKKYGWEKYGFLKYFEKLILSHEVNALKPEEKIYRAVEKYTLEESSFHFFIDDVEEYVSGAKKCGWSAVQFTGYEDLITELSRYNIL